MKWSCSGFRDKKQSKLLTLLLTCLDTALTLSGNNCSEHKVCSVKRRQGARDETWDCWDAGGGLSTKPWAQLRSKFYTLTWNQSCNFLTDWWRSQSASWDYKWKSQTAIWNLTHRANILTGTFSQLGLQMCWVTGLLSTVWVWMLVKIQFSDVASAVSLSLFF